jgi:hypothetical protein
MVRLFQGITASLVFIAAAAAMAGTASAQTASQTRYCPTRESFFGTIDRVQGNMITVVPASGHWGTVLIDNNTHLNAHGYALRPGTYIGAFGCVSPNGDFHASEVTLAANAGAYSQTISGVVRRISGDQLYVSEPARHTEGLWIVPDVDDFHVGQTVTGIGMMSASGAFYPQSINGASTAYVPTGAQHPSITLSGIVRRVQAGALVVWEPARRTTGTWFVRNASAFHVGQNVTGTGTENRRGDFFPYSVHAQ